MHIENKPVSSIVPYARNPRRNSLAIAKVKASVKEFGWQQPIVVDKDMVIIAGHTRYQAALDLGMETVPVHIATDLTPAQVKAYRIADNRTASEAEWDNELLALEFEELKEMEFDLDLTGFDDVEIEGLLDGSFDNNQNENDVVDDDTYSKKIVVPIYEPKGEMPKISELFDDDKTRELIEEIKAANIPDSISDFLEIAAQRHTVFNFRNIAEYYSHADKDIQRLMEKSALVIIDFKQAIENGFVHLTEKLGEIADMEEA